MKINSLTSGFALALSFFIVIFANSLQAQNICNPNGNLIIYTNYDGGTLNISVDQNISNLVIGVVGYEATSINLSGPFVGNVTGVHYAGFNGTNNPCGGVLATSINGAPVGASTSTVFAPTATLSNVNGYGMIICGYSCSNNTNQGGCNTVDQIEAYFAGFFPGSSLYAHMVQYNCWAGTYSVSAGGSCCPAAALLQGSVAASQSICPGGTVTPFTSVVPASGGTGTIGYQWESSITSPNAGFSNIPGAIAVGYNPPVPAVTTYYRRGASTSANPTVYSNVVTVSINPLPTLTITSSNPVCETHSIFLNAAGGVSYTWMGPNGFTSNTQNPVITNAQFMASGIYSVTVTGINGCTATSFTTVIVAPNPIVTAIGATVCVGQPAVLTASGGVVYSWSGPQGYTSTSASATVSLTNMGSSGVYTVVVSSANSCTAMAAVNVAVIPLPTITVSNSQNIVICKGNSVTLNALGAETYTWSGATATGSASAIASPGASTVITVVGTASGCINPNPTSVVITVNPCTGIESSIHEKLQLLVYPNPSQSRFVVKASAAVELHLVNNLGQLIRTITLHEKNAYECSIGDLPEGLYYLGSESNTIRQKIVVMR